MRIFAIGCMHGKLPDLDTFIRGNKIDIILSLGDHCDGDELRSAQFSNWEKFKGKDYYKVMKELFGKRYETVYKNFAESGQRVLEYLDTFNLPVFVLNGNNDFTNKSRRKSGLNLQTLEDTVKKSNNLLALSGKTKVFGDFAFVGVPFYRGASIKSKEDKNWRKIDNEMQKKLDAEFSKTKGKKILFIGHDMPVGCKFDIVNNPDSPMHGKHVGDAIIREFIIDKSPLAYIGAHMHEWQGKDEIGNTYVIHFGYGREGQCALIELPGIRVNFVKV